MWLTRAFTVAGHKLMEQASWTAGKALDSGPGASAPVGLALGQRSLCCGPAPSPEFDVAGLKLLCAG